MPLGGGASHPVYEVVLSGQDALFVALVDARTLIASPGKDYVVDALKAGRQGKPPVLRNKEFQQTLEKLDPKLTVAVALLGKAFAGKESGLPEPVCRALAHVEVLGGGVLVSNEVKADLVVVTRDEAAARSLRQSVDARSNSAWSGCRCSARIARNWDCCSRWSRPSGPAARARSSRCRRD